MIEKKIMSGNEAIARGAYEGGVLFASAYPGTPSTEILENMALYKDVKAEWSPNEKVALEVGMGAAFVGARVLVAMKHVGLNVAADPLMTLAYTGIKGGLVIVSADDPGMHSSQNEQDNRFYAKFAEIPLLEPSDSQEALDMTKLGFEISEQFDTPVLLRMTTRICHSLSVVELNERIKLDRKLKFDKDPSKYVMIPMNARRRHVFVKERLKKLKEFSNTVACNKIEEGNSELAIITSGVSYQYVKESYPQASVLKLGFTNPLPEKIIKQFIQDKKEVLVIEELEPFMEDQIKSWGINVKGKSEEYKLGELSTAKVESIISGQNRQEVSTEPPKQKSGKPPVLCAGCGHRAAFLTLRDLKLTVMGDIGCYSLATLPPLDSHETCVCMGSGINHAVGMSQVLAEKEKKETVAVIGDSTFVHSGITGIIEMVYNKADTVIIILDNRITAMTGRQDHPGTGYTLQGEETHALDYADVCRAVGVKFVKEANPYNIKEFEQIVKEAIAFDGPAVIISKAECVLIRKSRNNKIYTINEEKCKMCGICLKTGCPAIKKQDKTICIDANLCIGCGLCFQVCKFNAINTIEEN